MRYLGCDLGDVRDFPLPFLHVKHRPDAADDSDVPLDLEQFVVNASAQLILLHTGEEEIGEGRGVEERRGRGR